MADLPSLSLHPNDLQQGAERQHGQWIQRSRRTSVALAEARRQTSESVEFIVQITTVFPMVVTNQSIPHHAGTELRSGGNIDRLCTVCSAGSVIRVAPSTAPRIPFARAWINRPLRGRPRGVLVHSLSSTRSAGVSGVLHTVAARIISPLDSSAATTAYPLGSVPIGRAEEAETADSESIRSTHQQNSRGCDSERGHFITGRNVGH